MRVALAAGIVTTTPCAIPQLDETTFEAAVLRSPSPVFVHFGLRGCEGCEVAARHLAHVMDRASSRAKVFCILAARSPGLAARYLVVQYPTILVFREGRVARRLVGHPLPGELEVILKTELP